MSPGRRSISFATKGASVFSAESALEQPADANRGKRYVRDVPIAEVVDQHIGHGAIVKAAVSAKKTVRISKRRQT
jgi:hypothetical protein